MKSEIICVFPVSKRKKNQVPPTNNNAAVNRDKALKSGQYLNLCKRCTIKKVNPKISKATGPLVKTANPINTPDKIIFIINHIVDELNSNQTLLTFISKNLSWGIFKEALTTKVASDDINFKDVYYEMINAEDISLEEPEIMLFLIVELVSSTCYSAILYKEPADIDTIKPYLFKTVRAIIKEHTIR